MKKLIITADDYGMSNAVNRAIEAGVEIGLITLIHKMNFPCLFTIQYACIRDFDTLI